MIKYSDETKAQFWEASSFSTNANKDVLPPAGSCGGQRTKNTRFRGNRFFENGCIAPGQVARRSAWFAPCCVFILVPMFGPVKNRDFKAKREARAHSGRQKYISRDPPDFTVKPHARIQKNCWMYLARVKKLLLKRKMAAMGPGLSGGVKRFSYVFQMGKQMILPGSYWFTPGCLFTYEWEVRAPTCDRKLIKCHIPGRR